MKYEAPHFRGWVSASASPGTGTNLNWAITILMFYQVPSPNLRTASAPATKRSEFPIRKTTRATRNFSIREHYNINLYQQQRHHHQTEEEQKHHIVCQCERRNAKWVDTASHLLNNWYAKIGCQLSEYDNRITRPRCFWCCYKAPPIPIAN